ncbi:sigma-70 family RNA polymerase sigma factor [Leucobacter chironomi]|uniref:sigma-70 family RNA polymerase sigma factor n=1 Tax=Leucobacter chironomi TaxID=491918 RepID=UPI0006858A9D|nr:sigma-70 family RNA polymerase sigma factor [Leucobacter chironomi]
MRSDSELLALSRDGDDGAFAELWRRHRLPGLAAARNIAPSLDADDLVAGAYLKIFELVRDGRGPTGAFRPYLYRVISSLAVDAYRSPEHAVADLETTPDLAGEAPGEEAAFDRESAARAFASLPERWRAVLWYTVVEGLPPREAAPLLGISANGVSALAARAREGLQSAWVEEHADMELADVACRTVRRRLQSYQRGKLPAKQSREVGAHLDGCDACTAVAAEFTVLNRQLALVLSVVVLGGGSAAAFAATLGAGSGVSAAAAAAAVSGGGAAGSGGAGAGGSAGGSSGGAGGLGGVVVASIAVVATAALAAAAVGGVLLVNSLASGGVESTAPVEAAPSGESGSEAADRSGDLAAAADAGGQQADEAAAVVPADPRPAREPRTESTVAAPQTKPGDGVPGSPAPAPVDPEQPVDPTDPTGPQPAGLLPGVECFTPDVDAGQYVISGRSNVPGSVELRFPAELGGGTTTAVTGGDRHWSSGAVSGLDALVGGAAALEARLVAGASAGPWLGVALVQCGGTGPKVVSGISVTGLCAAIPGDQPGTVRLDGALSEYGVVFARHRLLGVTTPIVDPLLDGASDLRYPWLTWHGLLARAGLWAPHTWSATFSLDFPPVSVDDYNTGQAGVIELRVQTPGFWSGGSGTTSTWLPVDALVECGP